MNDVKKRETFKNSIARVVKFTNDVPAFHKASRSELKTRLDNLEGFWEKYMLYHCEVEAVCGPNEIEFQTVEIESTETLYISAKAKLLEKIDVLAPASGSHAVASTSQAGNERIVVTTRSEVPLPPMNIPTFTGKPTEWMEFYALFDAHIHSKPRLTDSQKFQYLKSKLDGEAAQLVRNYALTDANYALARQALLSRYQNNRVIANAHLKALFNQPTVKVESTINLRKLIDTTNDVIRALGGLNIVTANWDPMIVFIVTERLDATTILEWERTLNGQDMPTIVQLTEFIERRCRGLEAASMLKQSTTSKSPKEPRQTSAIALQSSTSSQLCCICNENHHIRSCTKFLAMTVNERSNAIREKRRCFNCLQGFHSSRICRSGRCRHCSRKHHELLHTDESSVSASMSTNGTTNSTSTANSSTTQLNAHHQTTNEAILNEQQQQQSSTVLLATACVTIQATDGSKHIVRALLDTGSQASFISQDCVHRLRLKRENIVVKVSGLGSSDAGTSKGIVNIGIGSQHNSSTKIFVDALILNRITAYLPSYHLNDVSYAHLKNIELADKSFYRPGRIDLLLGADIYGHIIMPEIIRGAEGTPTAQRTIFGWVLSGLVKTTQHTTVNLASLHINSELNAAVKRFWEMESFSECDNWTEEEKTCDTHFKTTYKRDVDGRFIVKLPLKPNWTSLGSSKSSAISRLKQLELRFKRNPALKSGYIEFMREYLELGHMQRVSTELADLPTCYYIPHHAVMKEESTTTKLRVVFDASNKTTNGQSLNDVLMVGPTLQSTLYVILLRFRKYAFALTADVTKMYRQVKINEEHQDLQRIVWRENEIDPINEYRLTTVTYGTASAPFLAVRSLNECATLSANEYPDSSKAILRDMYVDDLITGAATEREAIERQQEISSILRSGGMDLRKWSSNSCAVLRNVPSTHRECKDSLAFEDNASIKALGIRWYPSADNLGYKVTLPEQHGKPTKRQVLADTARLFDPLGLLSPIIIKAKILLQKLWVLGIEWDEILPDNVNTHWQAYRNDLAEIERLKISRWLGTDVTGKSTQLHGFCDASEAAFAAVIFARTIDVNGKVQVNLITSKTKVSPVQQITLPRLELCGATLLAKLMSVVKKSLEFENVECYAWSDSTVVLAWLRKLPCNWKTFVANRVSQIQSTLDPSCWRYVPTLDNPADVASRGTMASDLIDHPLWWHGPNWLHEDERNWPKLPTKAKLDTKFDFKQPKTVSLCGTIKTVDSELVDKYSSINRLKLVTAIIRRFIENSRKVKSERVCVPITISEMNAALMFWLKRAQHIEFESEISCIESNDDLPRKSQLLSLNPYIDDEGLLRVGGRIDSASLPFDTKHPLILPPSSKITQLIISEAHLNLLHGGIQLMTSHIRQKYWLPRIRSHLKYHIHRCIPCFRQKKQFSQQQMGNLPPQRLTPARAFLNSGVDYAGPVTLRTSELRNSKLIKGYIAVFVCLCTRAIHLEMVSDLTTDAFLASFRRFVARRGKVKLLMSDNGTNFVGARRELKELAKILQSQYLTTKLTSEGTEWKLIPPSTPHFGGIWEAGVKSVKHHIRRVIGATHLTFEKMATLLTQIEACLNSRPLTPLSDDPSDMNALTPGHFLIGEPPSTVPDPNLSHIQVNRLSHWQHIQRMQQDFWSRWQKEYIAQLQHRPKWMQAKANVEIGNLVLLKDECLPPTHWPLGRIENVHPGADGRVRVVTVRYNGTNSKRPIHKLCVLPMDK